MTEGIYRVHIGDIFEGPMDLLVHLIRKNEVDIADIPIAVITDQYLAYLDWMQSMNIDLAGDFLVMAATLTQIKSRMLLPPSGEEGEEEDPRLEITRPLAEYLRMKAAADELSRRSLLGLDTFTRVPPPEDLKVEAGEEVVKIGLFELIEAFQKILANLTPAGRLDLTAEAITVKDKMAQIVDLFEQRGKSLTFGELFPEGAERAEVIVTFLAVLEMVKLGLVSLAQHVPTGIIRLFYL